MFRLSLLGPARIEAGGSRLTGEVAQRHRLALLALLAAARNARVPRERAMALLWPDQGSREARHLLNVSVHVIRKALGENAVLTEGDDLRLDTVALPTDVVQFREAVARGEVHAATELYGGPFLDGFFLDDAADFGQWQDAERARLAAEFGNVLEARAEAAEHAGAWQEAVRCWRGLTEHAPERGRVTLRLMQALEASGDRAGALQAAAAHTALLTHEFAAEPSPDVVELAARIRARPSRSVATPDRLTAHRAIEGTTPPAGAAVGRRTLGLGRVAVAAGLVIASVAAVTLRLWQPDDSASVAVLPFLDLSPESNQAHLSDGITEELLNALARIPDLHVAARSSSFQFRDRGVDVRMVGRRLGVAAVVEGSVRRDGDRLRVTAQLIDARNGYHLWSEQYDRRIEDVFAVQEDIARTVASALSAELVRNLPDTLVAQATTNPDAYDSYLRARHAWNTRTRDGMWEALRAFQQAIALDPGYAAAYAGLADTWQLLPDYGGVPAREGLAAAKTAALRAIALDSTLAEAHTSLAALLDDYDHDPAGAEREYRRAIELNPGYVTARHWFGIHLANQGRFTEGLEEIERARRLDPLSLIINTAVGAVRYFTRDYDAAIAEYRSVLHQAPNFALAWALMGRAMLIAGRTDSAVTALDRSVRLSGGDPSYRAVYAAALAAAGRPEEARRLAEQVRHVQPGDYVPYCELASAYLYLGDVRTALDLLGLGINGRDTAVKHLRVEPLYDRIRNTPSFRALLRRAGLALDTI